MANYDECPRRKWNYVPISSPGDTFSSQPLSKRPPKASKSLSCLLSLPTEAKQGSHVVWAPPRTKLAFLTGYLREKRCWQRRLLPRSCPPSSSWWWCSRRFSLFLTVDGRDFELVRFSWTWNHENQTHLLFFKTISNFYGFESQNQQIDNIKPVDMNILWVLLYLSDIWVFIKVSFDKSLVDDSLVCHWISFTSFFSQKVLREETKILPSGLFFLLACGLTIRGRWWFVYRHFLPMPKNFWDGWQSGKRRQKKAALFLRFLTLPSKICISCKPLLPRAAYWSTGPVFMLHYWLRRSLLISQGRNHQINQFSSSAPRKSSKTFVSFIINLQDGREIEDFSPFLS